MNIKTEQLAKMIDVSILKTDNTESDLQELIKTANQYQFICVFSLPCYLPELVAAFKDSSINVGAPIGFPTGAETTKIKEFQAKSLYEIGCDEFDMVMNIGFLKSGNFDKVQKDIQAVYNSINGCPLKVIVEAMYLTDNELVDACKIVMDSGAEYVKTGTGWAPKPTLLKHINIMANTVQNKIKIKAAGGIRDYAIICKMHEIGVTRFGVGLLSSISIMQEAFTANHR